MQKVCGALLRYSSTVHTFTLIKITMCGREPYEDLQYFYPAPLPWVTTPSPADPYLSRSSLFGWVAHERQ